MTKNPFGKSTVFNNETFKNISCSEESVEELEFHDCCFEKCNFMQTEFGDCEFRNVTFENCDLSVAVFSHTIFSGVKFANCKMIGIDWFKASKMGIGISMIDCVVNMSNFSGLKLNKTKLLRCEAKDCNFTETDLSKTDSRGTDFTDSTFFQADLREANFIGAMGYAISPECNKLAKAKFSLPEAVQLLREMGVVVKEAHEVEGLME